MNKYKIFLLALFLIFNISSNGQGFNWSDDIEIEYNKSVPELNVTRSIFPSSYSLEKYLPSRQYQGETSMCVAYSLAVGRTILYAKNNYLKSKNEINKHVFSPFFIYFLGMDKDDANCTLGLYPLKMLEISKQYGMIKMRSVEYPHYFPFTKNRLLCNGYPEDINDFNNDFQIAQFFTIDNYNRLETTNQIKSSISSKNPVIFGFSDVPVSFELITSNDKIWIPGNHADRYWCFFKSKDKTKCHNIPSHETGFCKKHAYLASDSKMGHSMLLIGYNDNINGGSFLILNSWGSRENEWGDKGKIWIKYEDFWKYSNASISISKSYETSELTLGSNLLKNTTIPSEMKKKSFQKKSKYNDDISYSSHTNRSMKVESFLKK